MTRCEECGLLDRGASGEGFCLKFRRVISGEEEKAPGDCLYFTPIQYDCGELLTPRQHLVLKERELSSKKMRGPV